MRPTIRNFPWNTRVELSRPLTLLCEADGVPVPDVRWRSPPASSANASGTRAGAATLQIAAFRFREEGVCVCFAL